MGKLNPSCISIASINTSLFLSFPVQTMGPRMTAMTTKPVCQPQQQVHFPATPSKLDEFSQNRSFMTVKSIRMIAERFQLRRGPQFLPTHMVVRKVSHQTVP